MASDQSTADAWELTPPPPKVRRKEKYKYRPPFPNRLRARGHCSVPGCGRLDVLTKGMCKNHYSKSRSHLPDVKARKAASAKRYYTNPKGAANRTAVARRLAKAHPLRSTWNSIKTRTTNKRNAGYAKYGARGIRMHEGWLSSYRPFEKWILENLGPRPEGMTLDRINNDGHYEPGNLRWADIHTQAQNRRLEIAFRERPGLLHRIEQLESQRAALVAGLSLLLLARQ